MKRYSYQLMIILVLASGLVTSCGFIGTASEEQSTTERAELSAYITEELSITQGHRETSANVSKAIRAIYAEADKPSPDDPSKTQLEAIELPKPTPPSTIQKATIEAIVRSLTGPKTPPEPIIPTSLKEALTFGVDTLDWALEQMDAEILNYEKRSPPPEANTYHRLMREVLLKEWKAYNGYRSYYNALLQHGNGDGEALDKAFEHLIESMRLNSIAKDEFLQLWKDSIINR